MSRSSWLVALVVFTLVPLLAASVVADPRYAAAGEAEDRFHRYTLTHDDDLKVGCSRSTKSASKSCKDETKASYWLEVAKCQNLSDADEREECLGDASESRAEERELCREQYDARLEICDALGEAHADRARRAGVQVLRCGRGSRARGGSGERRSHRADRSHDGLGRGSDW